MIWGHAWCVDNGIEEKEYSCKVDLRRTSLSEQIFGYLLSITRGIRKPERLVLRSEYNLISEKKRRTNSLPAVHIMANRGLNLTHREGPGCPSKATRGATRMGGNLRSDSER